MCGIAGIVNFNGTNDHHFGLVEDMNNTLRHRGPDDAGTDRSDYCILGHRRLSIIDLSKDGHQPFISHDGRYRLVFNGELYNYIELRETLRQQGVSFTTATDTEVLLKMYEHYGTDCLQHFNGMFAFCIYDREQQSLFMARDRIGIKPLYYALANDTLYFASEIKALRKAKEIDATANKMAIFNFLVFNRTDVYDESFQNGIKRIPKGHYGYYTKENGLQVSQYWNPEAFIKNPNDDSQSTIAEKVEALFLDSIRYRMRSDVPVGSSLSGGLDSSIIVGTLYDKKLIGADYSTFTISFPGHPLDETNFVDALNKKYPFQNYRKTPTVDTAFERFEAFMYSIDEPVTGPSQYAQYELMQLVKEHGVTVLLDGQGGDENFAGYQYFHGFYLNGLLNQFRLLGFATELLKVLSRKQDRSAIQTLAFQLLSHKQRQALLLKTLPYVQPDFFYNMIGDSTIYNKFFDAPDLNTSLVRHFQYKLEHLLRYEDRNSMAYSIEARVPYLDHNLIEYLLSVPEKHKIKLGQTKYIQKAALGQYTIPEILNRKDKVGFGTPNDEWMENTAWKAKTTDSYAFLCEQYPEIFIKENELPKSGPHRWKINSLACWAQMIGS